MSSGFEVLALGTYVRMVGEENARLVLRTFDCRINPEVQDFDAVQYDQMLRVLEPTP